MTGGSSGAAQATRHGRVLGRLTGASAGPTLIVVGGLHGNEPSGVEAAERVIERLRREAPPLRGELVLIAGNLAALAQRRRFVHVDLNRQWTKERLALALDPSAGPDAPAEHLEQRELLATLREVVARARGELYFIDLHTSSAVGPPFVTIGDTLRNRRFAAHFPLPLILGLEEQVDGALLEMLNNHGFVTLGVEGGLHASRDALERHEAVLWLALVAARLLDDGAVELAVFREQLRRASAGFPAVIDVRSRHAITAEDGFRMRPGFSNFEAVRRGQVLAEDRRGLVRAPRDGLILLPLYQGQGEDGFFLCREVRPFWLRLSAVLRRLRLDGLLYGLPGVRHDPAAPDTLLVDTRIARLFPVEVFHLFGFRRLRWVGNVLRVSRRRFDLEPPASYRL